MPYNLFIAAVNQHSDINQEWIFVGLSWFIHLANGGIDADVARLI